MSSQRVLLINLLAYYNISKKNKQVQPPVGGIKNLESTVGVQKRRHGFIDTCRTSVGLKSRLYPSVQSCPAWWLSIGPCSLSYRFPQIISCRIIALPCPMTGWHCVCWRIHNSQGCFPNMVQLAVSYKLHHYVIDDFQFLLPSHHHCICWLEDSSPKFVPFPFKAPWLVSQTRLFVGKYCCRWCEIRSDKCAQGMLVLKITDWLWRHSWYDHAAC